MPTQNIKTIMESKELDYIEEKHLEPIYICKTCGNPDPSTKRRDNDVHMCDDCYSDIDFYDS